MTEVKSGESEEIRKYTYYCNVDPKHDDKSTEIKLFNFSRPHMRAFHLSWFSFFMAFFIWFAIAPLLPEISKTLGLTKQQVWTSNICSVAGTVFLRFLNGPLCDKYGARIPMGVMLMFASIPCACTGLANSYGSLCVIRFFIGFGGSTFVMCQSWCTAMFTKEVAGTANAMAAGWGNLGGGVTQLVMGAVLFPLFKTGMSAEKAWRTVCLVPACVGIMTGICAIKFGDDAPKGYFKDMKKNGTMAEVSAQASFRSGATNFNSWLMFIQYACCFGVELTMNNAAASYFKATFNLSTESAAAIASLFGWMNLFARGLGGFFSDKLNARFGMRGRLYAQAILLTGEGIMVLIFAHTKVLGLAIFVLVIFSLFVQAAEGSTCGIVPYIDPPATGSIFGITGAGGNVGAVCFGLGFRQLDTKQAFILMGSLIMFSGFSCALVRIKGHAGMITGKDSPEVIAAWKNKGTTGTLTVPEQDPEAIKDIDKDTDNNSEAEFNQFVEYVSEKNINVEK